MEKDENLDLSRYIVEGVLLVSMYVATVPGKYY